MKNNTCSSSIFLLFNGNKNKGFTLIELLAVIVIENTAYGVLEGIRLDYTERVANNNTSTAKTFTFPNSGLKLSGEEPQYVKVSIDSKGNIAFTLSDKDKRWCTQKDAGSEKVIVKDYSEETCALDFSFSEDSWSTVVAVLKSNPKIYGEIEELIGKEREVKINGYKNGTEYTFTVRLTNLTPCTTEESESACGIVFEFVDIITKKKMNTETEENPYGTNEGGGPASEIYNEVNTNIYDSLPEDLKKWNNSSTWWWLRSASFVDNYNFYGVSNTSTNSSSHSKFTQGIAPSFRIG